MLLVRVGSRLAVGSSARITSGRWASARDRNPLLLAPGELVGAALGEVAEADLIQTHPRQLAVGVRKAAEQARDRRHVAETAGEHVVDRGSAPHQVELLEDHADLPADLAHRDRAGAGESAAGDADGAGRRLDEPIETAQEGRLAGAASPEDDDEFAARDRKVDVLERDSRGRQDHAQARDLDHGRCGCRSQRGRTPSSSTAARTGS